MNFQLDAEQTLLQDSVRRFVDKAYACEQRGACQSDGSGNWQRFAEQGWLAAALPEAYGGLGGSVIETTLIAGEFGRGLVTEPYLGCAVLAAQTLAAAASPAQREPLLPTLADGSQRIALAYSEATSFGDPEVVTTQATPTTHGYLLDGCKTMVLGAVGADRFIVSARLTHEPTAVTDVALFLVDAGSPGLTLTPWTLHDGSQAAELALDRVSVGSEALLGVPGNGLAALRHGLAHAVAALGAELVGAMEHAIEITADYLKIRKQFGVAIGSFQALQHRMADMAAECEMARSMLYALLVAIGNDEASARDYAVSQAKALIGRAARFVCGQAIQLHGGIGMTEECRVGHYFKRAVVAELLFGNSDRHEATCAAALGRSLRRE
ncbi:acyl-CoA dehydrogenase [Cupriavidus necator]|uniref:Acyl-CoA dehydrogenase n=1 Tax=Cupriavidus necator TaxID=106590 RepID=A0A1U9UPF0_CUPNE|nr:acyl-CoA dehydrogenase family protein [Cupriavidus necator]AQV94035.1 acyl-CoA dehydrogenase [Cupriavidus necator]